MLHTPLQSSMLNSAGFEDGILEIEFKNGRRFKYWAERSIFDRMIAAESPGKFFNAEIKGRLPFVPVEATPPPPADYGELDI